MNNNETSWTNPVGASVAPDQNSEEIVSRLLTDHATWLTTDGKQGSRVNLSDKSLKGADLSQSSLRAAILNSVDFGGANLSGASLDASSLSHANFAGANLTGCSFVEANLEEANLSGSFGLAAPQLAGADLTGAKLPEPISNFDLLTFTNDLSKDNQRLLAGLLLACGYCWLTVATTSDVQLFRNTSSSELPIIRTAVPLSLVYVLAPLLLLGLYVHFHIYMQRLWEALALLPSVFPDGIHLRQKITPWIYNGFIFAHLPHGSPGRHALSSVQLFVCVLLAWALVPISVVVLWIRYLWRQNIATSLLQSALVACCCALAIHLHALARNTLRERKASTPTYARKAAVSALLVFCLTGGLSLAVYFVPPPFALLSVNLQEAEVSSKPPGWEEQSRNLSLALRRTDEGTVHQDNSAKYDSSQNSTRVDRSRKSEVPITSSASDDDLTNDFLSDAPARYLYLVKGAQLAANRRELNFQLLRAFGAFLVNADLRGANLRQADLVQADLRGALLQHANLEKAHLIKARLNFAHLEKASLVEADLSEADLRRADLFQANLEKAQLRGARLENSHVIADLRWASFVGANLLRTTLAYCRLDGANFNNAHAQGIDLTRAIAAGADLTDADLRHADLTEADLSGADLRWSNLANATLSRTRLVGAHLQDVDMRGADLTAADLSRTQLDGADLSGAKLKYVKGLTQSQLMIVNNDGTILASKIIMNAATECPDTLVEQCHKLLEYVRASSDSVRKKPDR